MWVKSIKGTNSKVNNIIVTIMIKYYRKCILYIACMCVYL